MRTKFIIKDWAGNLIKFDSRPHLYDSFEDAEEVLSEELDDNYETDRQEYYITEVEHF